MTTAANNRPRRARTAAPTPGAPTPPAAPVVPTAPPAAPPMRQDDEDLDDDVDEGKQPADVHPPAAPTYPARPAAAPLPPAANPFGGPAKPFQALGVPISKGGIFSSPGVQLGSTFDPDSGSPYLRMIHPVTGHVCAIMVTMREPVRSMVVDKLKDGWQFIAGEPCLPRVWGEMADMNRPDAYAEAGWYAQPRRHPHPQDTESALRVWLEEAVNDSVLFANRTDLALNFAARLRTYFPNG